MEKHTIELPKTFTGSREVKNFGFEQLYNSDKAYLYKVTSLYNSDNVYYEVFKAKSVAKAIDFKNKIFSKTEFKDIYPSSRSFGYWAWTFKSREDAYAKFIELNTAQKEKQ